VNKGSLSRHTANAVMKQAGIDRKFLRLEDTPISVRDALASFMSHSVTCPYLPGMKRKTRRPSVLPVLATLLALVLTGVGTLPASAQACLSDREIQEAVSSGRIKSLYDVLASAGIDSSQSVLNVQVCDQGGRLVYIIGVLSPSGEAQNLVLDAQ
jgi:hypothetical protein